MPNDELDRLAFRLQLLVGGPPQSLHERITEALEHSLTLRLFPDQRLPAERQLAELLGVSRITVRQSLETLRERGWIDHSRRGRSGGSRALPRAEMTDHDWQELLDRADTEIADILAFRSVIEPQAARLAAASGDEGLDQRLSASVAVMAAGPDLEAFRRSDSEFHFAISAAAGNRRLMRSIDITRAELLRWRDLLPMPDYVESNLAEHREIADAITAGDQEGAAAAMARHLETTRRGFWDEVLVYRRRHGREDE